jgi:hypothetical protein
VRNRANHLDHFKIGITFDLEGGRELLQRGHKLIVPKKNGNFDRSDKNRWSAATCSDRRVSALNYLEVKLRPAIKEE